MTRQEVIEGLQAGLLMRLGGLPRVQAAAGRAEGGDPLAQTHRKGRGRPVTILRVFPCRTAQTPDDDLAYVGWPQLWLPEVDEVHISVTFTWDMPLAVRLAEAWGKVAPVKIGGPATEAPSGDFTPGMYVKRGVVFTSRGCPRRCSWCLAWKREGKVRELPITDGHLVQDDNLLACSDEHVRAVFAMLHRQKAQGHRPQFTGGLDVRLLKDWHITALRDLRPKQMFFACDSPEMLRPVQEAGERLLDAGWTVASRTLRCFVLIGYPGDTPEAAEERCVAVLKAGFWPMAMLYQGEGAAPVVTWRPVQQRWCRPARTAAIYGQPATDDD